MEFIAFIINSVQFIWMMIGALVSFYLWWRVGFKAPRYLHVIAFVSGAIGVALAYMGYASGHEKGQNAIWLIVGFPVATYFIFGFYGGGKVMALKALNDENSPNK